MDWLSLVVLVGLLAGVLYWALRPRKNPVPPQDLEPMMFGRDTTQFAPGSELSVDDRPAESVSPPPRH